MTRLKETEGGAQAVCEVMERYEKIAVKNANIKKIIQKKRFLTSDILKMSSPKLRVKCFS